MNQLNRQLHKTTNRPVKIMQFGEGNFLRAFVDWILQDLNDKNVLNANVVVVQPMPFGRVADLAKQDGLYTVCLEGIDGGEKVSKRQVIDVLSDFVNPFEQYQKYLDYAQSEDLQAIVSNTTEAGIALDINDTDFTKCPTSFPGKLLALLEARYNYFKGDMSKGLAIIPCELIDNNGQELKRVLTELAKIRGMSEAFVNWLNNANHFTDTLVDRIVPGYPRDNAQQICRQQGYVDNNIVKAEIFHLWVLKRDEYIERVLPLNKSGLNVIFADDIKPYKERKVKILNGSHTALVPIAYLCGIDTVGESVADEDVRKYLSELINDVIKPTINLPADEMNAFANSVIERFENPFIRHELMSIALNATTKFATRLLPTYNHYVAKFNSVPKHILFTFAAMCVFYKGKRGSQDIALADSEQNMAFWQSVWQSGDAKQVAAKALQNETLWGQNLATEQNVALVAAYLQDIEQNGMRCALQNFLRK